MKKKQNEQKNEKSIIVDVEHDYNEEIGEESNYNDFFNEQQE